MTRRKSESGGPRGEDLGLGGIFKGLGELVEKLNELAQTGQEFSKTGELRNGGQLKGVYGFSIRTGLGGAPTIEPFGNITKDAHSGRAVVQEAREPMVDIFEEPDHVLVLAEMPGISLEDVQVEVKHDWLTISAHNQSKKYRKEIHLPQALARDQMQISCNNGVLEIKCLR